MKFLRRQKEKATFPSWILIFIGDLMAVWVIRCTANPSTPTCLNSSFITAHPTSKLYSPPWCIWPEVCMTVISYFMKWSFSKALSAEQLQSPADLCSSRPS
jgi:hypothetical protein